MKRRLATLLLAFLTLSGCAYYNTFYMARKAWDQAMTERRRNATDLPSATELQAYDSCIRACNGLLVRYPQSKYVDDAMLLIGRSRLGRGEYEQAIDQFQSMIDSLPNSELVSNALLGKGQALSKLRRLAEAESTMVSVLNGHPELRERDELLLSLGDLKRTQKRSREALDYYAQLLREFPKSDSRYLALTRRGDTYFQLEEWDSSRIEFERVIEEAPHQADRIAAQLRVGESYEGARQYDQAITYYRLVEPEARKQNRDPEVQLKIAGVELQRGNLDKAAEMYTRLLEANKNNKYGGAAAFQLGYIEENYKDDFDKARTFYDQVKTLPRSDFYDQAAERTAGLTQAADYRKKLLESHSHFDQQAENAYSLGELYYFQIKKPERAAAQFQLVERTYSYTRFGPKAAYATGWTLDRMRRATAADSAYARAAVRYPATPFGAAAHDSVVSRFGVLADSILKIAFRDTTNTLLPKPPEAIQDSIQQASYADSVRKVAVADSLRKIVVADSLQKVAEIQKIQRARSDSLRVIAAADTSRRAPARPDSAGGAGRGPSPMPGGGIRRMPVDTLHAIPEPPPPSSPATLPPGAPPGRPGQALEPVVPGGGAPVDSSELPPPAPVPVPPDSTGSKRDPGY